MSRCLGSVIPNQGVLLQRYTDGDNLFSSVSLCSGSLPSKYTPYAPILLDGGGRDCCILGGTGSENSKDPEREQDAILSGNNLYSYSENRQSVLGVGLSSLSGSVAVRGGLPVVRGLRIYARGMKSHSIAI